MNNKSKIFLFTTLVLLFNISGISAQISAPGSETSVSTNYPAFPETDNIFIFCTGSEEIDAGSLTVRTGLEGTKTFLWEKYNSQTAEFEMFFSENSDNSESSVSSLESGGYKVTVTLGETTEIYRAWIFNNHIAVSAEISESDCFSFRLNGTIESETFVYYDPETNSPVELTNDFQTEWKVGETTIASIINPQIFDPPYDDTEYTFSVTDRFGCKSEYNLLYESVAVKAQFSVDKQQGEAPLTVNFTNESKNATSGMYEWFFYRNLDDLKKEAEKTQQPLDSIMVVAYDDNPVYTYEKSGSYLVTLVAKNVTESFTCADTFYMKSPIIADTSFIAVPNVFTPNGDGINDLFIVRFWSMQSIKISIFNRWGKRIHYYESGDVRGFEDTYTATVWDGRLNGRYATPGVYYYVVEGKGRDNKNKRAKGFFHLFRGKD